MSDVSVLQSLLNARAQVPQQLADRYEANSKYIAPGDHAYNTPLPLLQEFAFRNWLNTNKVPFNTEASVTDYDMRGFYKALQQGDPRAVSAVNPNDNQMHFPDYWKTPYHETFSQDSQWAAPMAPQWNAQDQLVSPGARILFDERRQQK